MKHKNLEVGMEVVAKDCTVFHVTVTNINDSTFDGVVTYTELLSTIGALETGFCAEYFKPLKKEPK